MWRITTDVTLGSYLLALSRDAFAGHRRGLAFELLGQVGSLVDLPDVRVKARQALRKAQSVESRQAATFLEEYFQARGLSPDDDTVCEPAAMNQVGRGGGPRGIGASWVSFRAATNQRSVLNRRGDYRRGFHANSGRNAD